MKSLESLKKSHLVPLISSNKTAKLAYFTPSRKAVKANRVLKKRGGERDYVANFVAVTFSKITPRAARNDPFGLATMLAAREKIDETAHNRPQFE